MHVFYTPDIQTHAELPLSLIHIFRPLLYLLAGHCYKAGIPEEEAVRQVMMHYYREADEQLVRMTLHNLCLLYTSRCV